MVKEETKRKKKKNKQQNVAEQKGTAVRRMRLNVNVDVE